jgi:hypothetical protein
MKDAFIEKNFSPDSLDLISVINRILDKYADMHYKLSLRQVYYQLVAGDLIPDKWRDKDTGSTNNFRAYKNVGSLVSDARQAGYIDWAMIEDRGRETVTPNHWKSPADIVKAAAEQYRIDKWEEQPVHVEVMVEKDALSGILEPVCRSLDVSLTANKGYSSSSSMYEIGQRLAELHDNGTELVILYLGDHDPSGLDMGRDVQERLCLYSRLGESDVDVQRIALNMDQIRRWNPPVNPVKDSDARSGAYHAAYGDNCWELDAVEPAQLAKLVTDAVHSRLDIPMWNAAVRREEKMRQDLQDFADTYQEE